MPIVVPETGAALLLPWLLNPGSGTTPDLSLSLFLNDIEPDWESEGADFVKPVGSWYEDKVIEPDTWSFAADPEPKLQGTNMVEHQWTSGTGVGTVFGYFVSLPGPETLVWAERLAVPITLSVGLQIKIRPRFALWSHYLPPGP